LPFIRGLAFNTTWVFESIGYSFTSPIVPRLLLVNLVELTGRPIVSWMFHETWPLKCSTDTLSSTESDIRVETLEFTYSSSERSVPIV
jgi:T4-like virus tail tube protein gp19